MATLYAFKDVDGDMLAIFGADIPGKGPGINIRTSPNGCSFPVEDIPELIEALGKAKKTLEERD